MVKKLVFSRGPRREGVWEVEVELQVFVTAEMGAGEFSAFTPRPLYPRHPQKTDHAFIYVFSLGKITWQAFY